MRSAQEIADRLERLRAYEAEADPETRHLVTAAAEALAWVLSGPGPAASQEASPPSTAPADDGSADTGTSAVSGRVSVLYPMDGSLLPARAWYAAAFGQDPRVDEADYVEFQLGASEVCLLQQADEHTITGVVPLFEVHDAEAYLRHLLRHEARLVRRVRTADDRVALYILQNPFGHLFGVIERDADEGG
ncbi:glyoxalase/bleomycin resistance/dioxygenase family protein [Rhodothermaceae bacterium RA]|nr:glyoxalase/bleomycin resistance/dioxygenase family protein [Rhodothermaceae bacterium RA]